MIKTPDPERLAGFYREALGFSDVDVAADRITLALRLVKVVLVRGSGGLQHSQGHAQKIHIWEPTAGQ